MSGVESRLLNLGEGNPGTPDEDENFLGLLTLSDPKQNGNALELPLLQSMIRQLQEWQTLHIRAVILRSSSRIAFSLGMNFAVFQDSTTSASVEGEATAAHLYRNCLEALYRFPAPVICLLEGPAKAGGVGLVMAADFVLATSQASLNLGEALFGLIPASVLPYLRKRISERRANQMVMTPDIFGTLDAETLFAWGLVDLPPVENLGKELKKILRSLLRCSPAALALQKEFSCKLSDLPLARQQELAEETLTQCLQGGDVRSGIRSFLEGSLGPWSCKPPKDVLGQLC